MVPILCYIIHTYTVHVVRRNTYIHLIILWHTVGSRIIVMWRENINVHSHTRHVVLFDSTKFTSTHGRNVIIMVCIPLQYICLVSAVLRGVQLTREVNFGCAVIFLGLSFQQCFSMFYKMIMKQDPSKKKKFIFKLYLFTIII